MAGIFSGIIFFPIPTMTKTSRVCLWIIRLVLLGGLAGMFYGMIHLFYSGQNSEDVSTLFFRYHSFFKLTEYCDYALYIFSLLIRDNLLYIQISFFNRSVHGVNIWLVYQLQICVMHTINT